MKTKEQDLAWKCLPSETREAIRQTHFHYGNTPNKSVVSELEAIFGQHNILSDTEPRELVFIERVKLQEMFETGDRSSCSTLAALFGDKCLPDKEESAQVEPKFQKGNIVKNKLDGKIYKIYGGDGFYLLENEDGSIKDGSVAEQDLELYSEPKFKVGDKCNYKGEVAEIIQIDINNSYPYLILPKNRFSTWVDESELEPYTEPETKRKETQEFSLSDKQNTDNMEEKELSDLEALHKLKQCLESKELNLCELLKGCEGEEIFDIEKGIVKIFEVKTRSIGTKSDEGIIHFIGKYIEQFQSGGARFYPSRALYEKYPLDAYSAWVEWKESRKPKRWRAQQYEKYWYLDRRFIPKECIAGPNESFDNTNYENGNYFRTEELAKQAAEAVRKCLEQFHQCNNKCIAQFH